ncbi:MAG TPA: FG-GAP-like repeat-containing protein [Gemmatimonadaceae bacterium]|nr:FG-GAP-like repeat-containing protein [Gemmatimonadaceae bacterium]
MGILWLGFNRSPGQIAAIVAIGCGLDMALHWLLRKRELLVPLSAYISSLSIAILLNFAHDYLLLALPIFLTIGSKYVLTYEGKHHFNPSLFGIATTLLFAGHLVTAAPAYQWGGSLAISAFIVTLALAGFVFRIGRGWLIVSFLATYALQTALRAWLMRAHLPPEMLFLGTLTAPPFFLFTFFMLTDPRTSPATRGAQIATGVSIALVDLVLHRFGSVFTFFYAAFIVATARFLWLHGRAMWREGIHLHVRDSLLSRRTLRAVALVAGVGIAGAWSYERVLRPHVAATDPGFRLREIPAAMSGLAVTMDPASLDLVDPRLRHIAKWLLSVGSSAEVADVDGDGRQDVLLTSPLAIASDRVVLWLNRGGMRFERTSVPALAQFAGDPKVHGLASGALFLDYDNDGDQDLLVVVSFGSPRLLRNMRVETGSPGFEDVTERAGVGGYAISIAANVLDYDRDGHPDILIGNVLDPHLREYRDSTRLSIFALPQPAYPGDRRMFAFMHDGWHDANNGGRNVLLHNRGDGTFETVDAAAMGMPETHWTLAIGTGDFNGDGWTDLYLASDFGRDDLYMNEGGRRFRRVHGAMFGEIGMDTYKGMNSTVADFDRDGRLDVYVSNVHHALQAEGSLLWMNRGLDARGDPDFHDEASARGALNEDRFGWGAANGDLQNDGWTDIVQANGMVDDRLDHRYDGCPDYWYVNHKLMQAPRAIHVYADMWGDLRGRCIYPNEARRVYLNRGASARPQFVDAAAVVGLTARDNSRGVALADFDDDGRLDVLIANQHGGPTLLHNVATTDAAANAWIGLSLVGDGRGCARDAAGSTITVRPPGQPPFVREVQRANGLSAEGDQRVHIGLGRWSGAVPVSIRWCGGETRSYSLAPNAYHEVRQ